MQHCRARNCTIFILQYCKPSAAVQCLRPNESLILSLTRQRLQFCQKQHGTEPLIIKKKNYCNNIAKYIICMKQGTPPQLTISIMHGRACSWEENGSRIKQEYHQNDEYVSADGW